MDCKACNDTGMTPVYLGGGYTGVALCTECAMHRETDTTKDFGERLTIPRVGPMVRDGTRCYRMRSVRDIVGRAPMDYDSEFRLAQLLRNQWLDTQGSYKIVPHQSYEGAGLLEKLRRSKHA